MAFYSSLWGLFVMLVVNLFANRATGIADQVVQLQDWSSVLTGEFLKLESQVTSGPPPGPVKWFLGSGPSQKLIYADKTHKESERVTRYKESSDTDFSIILHNVTLKDAGTYYCVKQKRQSGGDKDWKSGRGTQVVVKASNNDRYIIPFLVGVLLVFLLAAAIYFYRRKKRGWNRCTSSSETSLPESTKTPNQLSGDKELVYADLKDPKGLQRAKPSNPEERSEYVTIRITQTVPGPST